MDKLCVSLRIEGQDRPLCVETRAPVFTWHLDCDRRCCKQTRFRLRVTDSRGGLLWDSGPRESDRMTLPYEGTPIPPETTCRVSLTVWDNLGQEAQVEAEFRTGLMESTFQGFRWSGARWIGTGTRDLRPEALTVFSLSCRVKPETGWAGLLLGADDPRLMDQYQNIQGVSALPGESYVQLVLDAAARTVSLYRVGYTREDRAEMPLFTLPAPGLELGREVLLELRSNNGMVDVLLDGEKLNQAAEKKGPFDTGAININPIGAGNDYLCFPALCGIGVQAEPGQKAAFRHLTVRNYRQPGSVLFSALAEPLTLEGEARRFDPRVEGMPLLRREFQVENVARAYLTITARGVYEAYLNGQKVGGDYLAPGLTQYNRTHMYQVYEVTDLLRPGDNALGVALGEGWWSGPISFQGENQNYFGDQQSVILKLSLEKTDGSVRHIVSDQRFSGSTAGPICHASLFQGQVYDGPRAEAVAGWTEPGFRGSWAPAREIPLSADNTALGDIPGALGIQHLDHSHCRCMGQVGGGVRCTAELPAQKVWQVRPGVFLYDFGQNIAGVPKLQFPAGLSGKTVTLRYGEVLYPELPEYGDLQGMLMVENLRAALVTDQVRLGAGELTFAPQFTFHGFRYMELTGLEEPLAPERVSALALSSVDRLTADYRCSDPRVNQLFDNICWSLRDNFLSIPTDCPQRNERMGWSGDLSVFSRTAVYLWDADAFLRRHMLALRDLQGEDGMFPAIAPIGGGFGGILWGSAGMTVPWEAYLQYGDKAILEEHYDAMVRYMEYLGDHVDPETGLQTAGELGDWLGPQNGKTENGLLWMAYYIYDLEIMAKTARLLEKPQADAYELLWYMTRQRFSEVYFDPESHRTVYSSEDAAHGNRMVFEPIDRTKPLPPREPCGGYRMDTQSSYCVPLALDCVEEDHITEAQTHLAHACMDDNLDDSGNRCPPYSLMTGFIGTAWLLPALSQGGRDDVAYRMLLNERYPSWLYPVAQGATTIWERLDSYTLEKGFGGHNSMNSFNHYSFGAVGQWLLSRSLGIAREQPGFQRFTLCPMPDEDQELTWAQGWCETVSGRIESAWQRIGRGWEYRFTVPANTSCLLQLPGNPFARITESGQDPAQAEGVTVLGHNGSVHQFWLDAGKYVFRVER